MISKEERKQAARAFKERKVPAGIYAVRCKKSGAAWVGSSRNLAAVQNSLWFSLRMGNHLQREVQEEWKACGEESFSLEVLETLAADLHPLEVADRLKERRAHWAEKLSARTL